MTHCTTNRLRSSCESATTSIYNAGNGKISLQLKHIDLVATNWIKFCRHPKIKETTKFCSEDKKCAEHEHKWHGLVWLWWTQKVEDFNGVTHKLIADQINSNPNVNYILFVLFIDCISWTANVCAYRKCILTREWCYYAFENALIQSIQW